MFEVSHNKFQVCMSICSVISIFFKIDRGRGVFRVGRKGAHAPPLEGRRGGGHRDMREKMSKNATIKCDFSRFSSQREVKTPSPGSLRAVH